MVDSESFPRGSKGLVLYEKRGVDMAVVGMAGEALGEALRVAQHAANWAVDGPKNVFAKVDPLSDLLKLVQRISEITKQFVEILPLQHVARAFSKITDFINARNFIGRISDIVSGAAAWRNPFAEGIPDFLKVGSKLAYLFGDFAATAKWLSSIEVLGSWVKDSTAQLVSWGKEFNILKGIGDVSCITGALLNIADSVRLIVRELEANRFFRGGRFNVGLVVDHFFDVAYDVTKIAGAILSNIPGVHVMFTLVSLTVGSTLSLGKFFKKTYWVEDETPQGAAGGANPVDASEEESEPSDFQEVVGGAQFVSQDTLASEPQATAQT